VSDVPEMICIKCECALVPGKAEFIYLGRNFFAEVPVCPKCGAVYISEEFVKDRMMKVETAMEDK
jgi:RNase P subunit RPR2